MNIKELITVCDDIKDNTAREVFLKNCGVDAVVIFHILAAYET